MQPRSWPVLAVTVTLVATLGVASATTDAAPLLARDQWPQWRGPLGTGVAPHGNPPVTWSEANSVRWKIELPGTGHSTPVVWGDRIFLTSAVPSGEAAPAPSGPAAGAHDNVAAWSAQQSVVLAVDRNDGRVVWRRTVQTGQPHESTHESGSWASNSPVTDGERVYAFFGSRGLHALDLDGNIAWQKDLGDMHILHGHGEGSSPALHDGTLVVDWDHEGDSFLIALDSHTGAEKWKVARDERTAWATPLIVEQDGKPQVIVSATKRVRAYDLASGSLRWECGGLSGNVVASPVAAEGMVFVGSSYEIRSMFAIRLAGAGGDLTGTDHVAWKIDRDTPYVPSPLLYGDTLFFLKHYQGLVTAVDAKTGQRRFGPERLTGLQNVYASLVGAADRVYVVSREGTTAVFRRGPTFELLATNQLDDSFSASPAIVGDSIYLRGERFLYRIAADPKAKRAAGVSSAPPLPAAAKPATSRADRPD